MSDVIRNIDVAKIDATIKILDEYINDASLEPLIAALRALRQEPNNQLLLEKISETFSSLGIIQGAVLTYAPYLTTLFSHDLFEDRD